MTFQQLLQGAEVLSQSGNPAIAGVEYDSRRVRPGTLFVAMKGETSDGNRFIDQAIASGAAAVVTDSGQESPRNGVAWAQVTHGRRALARVSANFYKRPAERISITGITGTNGKSTTTFLLEAIFNDAGCKTALVGTIEYHIAGKVLPSPHTTPESLELNQLLAEALSVGVTEAVMEVSSHALDQQRVFAIPFDVAVFTNLSQDHLDYHRTMDEYFQSKKVLFEGCGTDPPRVAVINTDDEHGRELERLSRKKSAKVFSYGFTLGDFHAESVEISPRGTRFQMVTPAGKVAMWTSMIGHINVYNVLAASAAAFARGCSLEMIAKGVAQLASVPGRFERVDCGQPFTAVVDYAHTDDALANVLRALRPLTAGKLRVLFGCGGDRDPTKRPRMAKTAATLADAVVVTSDNPRTEDPGEIIRQVLAGVPAADRYRVHVEPDRAEAITAIIRSAEPGDVVLLAGKGHEDYQIIGTQKRAFDDRLVAAAAMRGRLEAPTASARVGAVKSA